MQETDTKIRTERWSRNILEILKHLKSLVLA